LWKRCFNEIQKFTIFLLPDDESYQVIFPHYPNCITHGVTIEEALKNAKEAIELHLEGEAERGADPIPPNAHVPYVIIAEIAAEVPESLIEVEEAASATG
jgi:predicted RNase H-like HicB family nuclease